MRYFEIVGYPRRYDENIYPVKAQLDVEAEHFGEIERLIGDQTQARVIGHDLGEDGRICVHVACTCEAVKRRLESRWT